MTSFKMFFFPEAGKQFESLHIQNCWVSAHKDVNNIDLSWLAWGNKKGNKQSMVKKLRIYSLKRGERISNGSD